jgi:hypothetical protein
VPSLADAVTIRILLLYMSAISRLPPPPMVTAAVVERGAGGGAVIAGERLVAGASEALDEVVAMLWPRKKLAAVVQALAYCDRRAIVEELGNGDREHAGLSGSAALGRGASAPQHHNS